MKSVSQNNENDNVLYTNSRKQFLLSLLIVIFCIIVGAISVFYTTEYFQLMFKPAISKEKHQIYTSFFVSATIIAIICLYFGYSFYTKIKKYRDLVIYENGILTYWLFSFISREYIPFSSIAAYYITEIDFESISKKLKDDDRYIVPIVKDVGSEKGFSNELNYGNDLVVYTTNKKVLSFLNIDYPQEVFDILSTRVYSKKYKSPNSNLTNEKLNIAGSGSAKEIFGETIQSKNYISGMSKDTVWGITALCFIPTILCIIFEILFYIADIDSSGFSPATFLLYIQIGIFLLLPILYLISEFLYPIYYKKKAIMLTTNKSLIITNLNNEIQFKCLASEIESCCFYKYVLSGVGNNKPDYRYAMEIITQNRQSYVLEEIFPNQTKGLIRAINILLLTEKGVLEDDN